MNPTGRAAQDTTDNRVLRDLIADLVPCKHVLQDLLPALLREF
jgi:hypothetical protein